MKKFLEWGLVKVQEEGIRTPCNPWCTPTSWCKPPPWCTPTPCCFLLKWNQNIFRSWITFLCAAAFSRILQVTLKSEFQLVWCICSDLCVKCSSAAPICAISHFHLHYNLVYTINLIICWWLCWCCSPSAAFKRLLLCKFGVMVGLKPCE